MDEKREASVRRLLSQAEKVVENCSVSVSFEDIRQRLLALTGGDPDPVLEYNLPQITLRFLEMWCELAGDPDILKRAEYELQPLPIRKVAPPRIARPDDPEIRRIR